MRRLRTRKRLPAKSRDTALSVPCPTGHLKGSSAPCSMAKWAALHPQAPTAHCREKVQWWAGRGTRRREQQRKEETGPGRVDIVECGGSCYSHPEKGRGPVWLCRLLLPPAVQLCPLSPPESHVKQVTAASWGRGRTTSNLCPQQSECEEGCRAWVPVQECGDTGSSLLLPAHMGRPS